MPGGSGASGDFGVPGAFWGPRLSEGVLGSEAQKGSPAKGLGKEQEPSQWGKDTAGLNPDNTAPVLAAGTGSRARGGGVWAPASPRFVSARRGLRLEISPGPLWEEAPRIWGILWFAWGHGGVSGAEQDRPVPRRKQDVPLQHQERSFLATVSLRSPAGTPSFGTP